MVNSSGQTKWLIKNPSTGKDSYMVQKTKNQTYALIDEDFNFVGTYDTKKEAIAAMLKKVKGTKTYTASNIIEKTSLGGNPIKTVGKAKLEFVGGDVNWWILSHEKEGMLGKFINLNDAEESLLKAANGTY